MWVCICESNQGCQIPWSWRSRWFWAAWCGSWVPIRLSARAVYIRNHWASTQFQFLHSFLEHASFYRRGKPEPLSYQMLIVVEIWLAETKGKLGTVVQAFNSSTREAQAGIHTLWVWAQPGLHTKTQNSQSHIARRSGGNADVRS